jgi:Tol biopolymer transport system component
MKRNTGLGVVISFALVNACAGSAPPVATPSPLLQATNEPTSTPATSPTSSPESDARVRPGEQWIVYGWGVPEADSVGNVIVRPDGTDEHWATPDAPIAAGDNAGDGWQLHPDWSPDGSQLAFVVDVWPYEDGHRDIWISDADGGNTRQLYDCMFPCDAAEYPAWSPDGESIVFVRWEHVDRVTDGSTLGLINVESGEVTTIAESVGADYFAYPRWSPDGTKIVVQIETWTNITEESELESTSVAIVDLTVDPETITKITEPAEWANYPDWHPTDDLIVFSRRPAGDPDSADYDLYTMNVDGSDQQLLVDDVRNATQPTWLPDGSGVIFVLVSGDDYTTATMWTVDADGSDLRPATTTEEALGGSHPRLRPLP